MEEREALRNDVPKLGLKATIPGGRSLQAFANEILDISSMGLANRNRLSNSGDNESGFLDSLRTIAKSGKTPADLLLEKFHGEWNGDISKIYEHMSF